MNELACLGWLTRHDELDLQSASSTDQQLWRVWRAVSAERETKNFLRALEGKKKQHSTRVFHSQHKHQHQLAVAGAVKRENERENLLLALAMKWKESKKKFLVVVGFFLNCLFVGLVGSFQSIVQFFAAFQAFETNFSASFKVFFHRLVLSENYTIFLSRQFLENHEIFFFVQSKLFIRRRRSVNPHAECVVLCRLL